MRLPTRPDSAPHFGLLAAWASSLDPDADPGQPLEPDADPGEPTACPVCDSPECTCPLESPDFA